MNLRVARQGALVYLGGGWLLGIVAGAATGAIWWPGAVAIGVAGLGVAALERRPHAALLGLLAAGLFVAGAWRYIDQRPPDEPTGLALHNEGASVRLRTLVVDEPDGSGRTQRVRLDVRELFDANSATWQPASGGVLLSTDLFPRYHYGDVLEFEGELKTPPSFPDFDYREYLARRGVVSLVSYPNNMRLVDAGQGSRALAALHAIRNRLGDALARALPEPQAALAQGIFLGQRTSIPAGVTADMNATGTSHLVAISGQNVSLVAGLVISSLAWLLGRRRAALVALFTITGYTALTGASPTVVRGAIMGELFVLATLVGRPASAATSIGFAAAIMTGLDPQVVHDVSFQLSFAAIAGLVYLTPPLQTRGAALLRRWGVEAGEGGAASFLLESLSVTAGAVLATLPLIALNFGRISAVGLIANLLLVPAFPLIMVSSALTAVAGVIWAPLGEAMGWFAWAMLSYMVEVPRAFASLPLASFSIDGFGRWHAAGAYVALAALAWWLGRRRRLENALHNPPAVRSLHIRPAWFVAGVLAIAAGAAWSIALGGGGGGRLTVSVLDVGQGDAILIETPSGEHILVDGGASGQLLAERLSDELPFWQRTIDLVALTHPQADHMNGLIDALQRYDVREVLTTPVDGRTEAYHEWRNEITHEAIPYHEAQPGDWIDLGDGATLRVLGPGTEALASSQLNNTSLVLKLTWRDASFLLTGDIEVLGEEALLHSLSAGELRSTVLKVAHHGSKTSSSPAFLRAVRPEVAVISVGVDNPYGHPAPAVIDRLRGSSLVIRTDERGTVRFSTDGERLWVETEGT